MTALEDRLRDAYRAAAETVDQATIPTLQVSQPQRARLSRRTRFLAPLAAAAAVTAVIVTVTTLAGGVSPRHHARTVKSPPAAPTAAASLPTFTLVDLGSSVQVYNTVTGVRVATLAPPAGQQFQDVASGGTPQSYLAATGLSGSACHAFFYRFHLSATGQPSKLTFLRSAPRSQPTAIAATPGGGTYAYSTVHCYVALPNGGVGMSGQAGNHFWEYPSADDYTFSLAATADGRTLALSLYVASGYKDLLLNTHSTSSTVEGASRVLTSVPASDTSAISPDGKTLYVCTSQGSTGTLAAYDAKTGAKIRVLHQWPGYSEGFICQIAIDPTGRFLLAAVTADVQEASTVIGFDLQTGSSATIPIHPHVPFRGGQFAW